MDTLIFNTLSGATIAVADLPVDANLTKRQGENICAKTLFEKILNQNVEIVHDENGKPFLKDNPLKISISHSKTEVAVIVDREKQVGIDIEAISQKILRLAERFLSKKELEEIPQSTENYTLAWATKETAFKIIGKKATDFRQSLEIQKIEKNDNFGIISLKFLNENKYFIFQYFILKNSVLVWGNE
ncbi:MAG: 4'-phosphopantetheinyl transferase superfamily protein [Paludibacter sp.]|nr:4'-phosphopantetheinyl transferase superfamily protein [Paludibacter sp.]